MRLTSRRNEDSFPLFVLPVMNHPFILLGNLLAAIGRRLKGAAFRN